MTELLTAAQMRAIEAAAIVSGEVTGLELMERAGRGVVEAVFEEWPELAAGSFRAVVLCGPGGNGGDGFVVARLLKEWGWEVEVFLYGTPDRMPPDARVNYERWLGMGEVGDINAVRNRIGTDESRTIYFDALFGTGLSRPLPQELAAVVSELFIEFSDSGVAIDISSGLCADSGRELGHVQAFPAKLTVTFRSEKIGHRLSLSWWRYNAKVQVVELDLCHFHSRPEIDVVKLNDYWNSACDLNDPLVSKLQEDHKYSHGHALILSGPPGHGGAARLSARGALRIGAGLVTVACPFDAMAENAARLDAVMLRAVGDGAGLVEVLADNRINALCLGPGLGLDPRAVGLVVAALGLMPPDSPPPPAPPRAGEGRHQALQGQDGREGRQRAAPLPQGGEGLGEGGLAKGAAKRPTVLDADALTILSQHPNLFAALHPKCILTPHAGEFARLFPDIAAKLAAPATKGPAYSKVDATREAAARAGCVVLFKGPDTVIADPSGRCSINSAHYDRAAPWLATAGSGDVLAGFITGLLARGFAPMQAAETAAWLHVECARSFGPGLIAEDLSEELPRVFRALGL